MNLELKNGKKISLDLNPIVLEYLSNYDGGIEQMRQDIKDKTNLMYVANHIAYSMLCGNIEEKLTFREAMSLIKIEDVNTIIDYIINNTPNIETNPSNSTIKRH